MREQLLRHGSPVDDRVAPVVQPNQFRQQLRAESVPVRCDRVDAEHLAHHAVPVGRAACFSPLHRPAMWSSTSEANTSSALATNRTAPSGWRHAPRPRTCSSQRSSRNRSVCSGARAVRDRRDRIEPVDTGTTLPCALAPRYRARPAVSTMPQTRAGSANSVRAPRDAPNGMSSESSKAARSALAAATQLPK